MPNLKESRRKQKPHESNKSRWITSSEGRDQDYFIDTRCCCCGGNNQEIGGFLLQCATCRSAYFCSIECFNIASPKHLEVCVPVGIASSKNLEWPSNPNQIPAITKAPPETRKATKKKSRAFNSGSCTESDTETESMAGRRYRRGKKRVTDRKAVKAFNDGVCSESDTGTEYSSSKEHLAANATSISSDLDCNCRFESSLKERPHGVDLSSSYCDNEQTVKSTVIPALEIEMTSSAQEVQQTDYLGRFATKMSACTSPVDDFGIGFVKRSFNDGTCSESESETESKENVRRSKLTMATPCSETKSPHELLLFSSNHSPKESLFLVPDASIQSTGEIFGRNHLNESAAASLGWETVTDCALSYDKYGSANNASFNHIMNLSILQSISFDDTASICNLSQFTEVTNFDVAQAIIRKKPKRKPRYCKVGRIKARESNAPRLDWAAIRPTRTADLSLSGSVDEIFIDDVALKIRARKYRKVSSFRKRTGNNRRKMVERCISDLTSDEEWTSKKRSHRSYRSSDMFSGNADWERFLQQNGRTGHVLCIRYPNRKGDFPLRQPRRTIVSGDDMPLRQPRRSIINGDNRPLRQPRRTIVNGEDTPLRQPRRTIINGDDKPLREPRRTIDSREDTPLRQPRRTSNSGEDVPLRRPVRAANSGEVMPLSQQSGTSNELLALLEPDSVSSFLNDNKNPAKPVNQLSERLLCKDDGSEAEQTYEFKLIEPEEDFVDKSLLRDEDGWSTCNDDDDEETDGWTTCDEYEVTETKTRRGGGIVRLLPHDGSEMQPKNTTIVLCTQNDPLYHEHCPTNESKEDNRGCERIGIESTARDYKVYERIQGTPAVLRPAEKIETVVEWKKPEWIHNK